MTRRRGQTRSGFTLYIVLTAAFVSFAAIGSCMAILANASRGVQSSRDRTRARSLCEGAWRAAQKGISEQGSAYGGFGAKALGAGEVSVVAGKAAEDTLRVTVVGKVRTGRGDCMETIVVEVLVNDSSPPGSRMGAVVKVNR